MKVCQLADRGFVICVPSTLGQAKLVKDLLKPYYEAEDASDELMSFYETLSYEIQGIEEAAKCE